MASALTPNDQWKALIMVRALDPAVISDLWQAIYHHLPEHVDDHPLGCHRKRVPDLLCFRGILIRLTTGSSSEDVEALMEYKVSDTTLRARCDEWIAAGVFAELEAETRVGYDRIICFDRDRLAQGCTRRISGERRPHASAPPAVVLERSRSKNHY
ncbi:hypothetical protein [Gemmatimonas sp.]|uniref:hypothetical protein n=1 Tax=Gemmatimonas sp. TaxID=1962908 RepID=UPI00356364E8